MKSVLFFLLCLISFSSSFGDTLAQFLTKDSPFIPYSKEQANQAAPVGNLTVGNLKAGQLFADAELKIAEDVDDQFLKGYLSQKPVLRGSASTYALGDNFANYPTFSICSFSMTAGSGSMINVESFSFVYSQLSRKNIYARAALPDFATHCLPMEFTLMAKINGGDYIFLQMLSVEGGTDATPWVLGKEMKFDLSSADIQAKIGNATSIEFDLLGKLKKGDDRTEWTHIAFDNISVDGKVVSSSPSVPEPSSAFLCAIGLVPLLRRKRNS